MAVTEAARLGNRAACVELLNETQAVCERLPATTPSRFSTESAEHIAHTADTWAASCYAALGDWRPTEQHARTAARTIGRWSPGQAAYAHLELGLALVNLGLPDEAAQQGMQALALGRSYGNMLPKARMLDVALRSRYPKVPEVGEFRARYEALACAQLPPDRPSQHLRSAIG